MEQLEESKNKIEGLLDWISNIGKEREKESNHIDQRGQNGNGLMDTSPQGIMGEEDDNNGNLLPTLDNICAVDGKGKDTHELDLDEQYNRIKVNQGLVWPSGLHASLEMPLNRIKVHIWTGHFCQIFVESRAFFAHEK